jgi:uncharacterized protein YdaU (DUF1376 family)
MSKVPWFKFFPADHLTDPDVDKLSLEAQAILIRMWSVVWLEGSIPGDVEELARKCKVRSAVMQMHFLALMPFFVPQADGTYGSERVEKERQRSSLASKHRSEAANCRWHKGPNAIASAKVAAKSGAKSVAKPRPVRSQNVDSNLLPPTPLQEGDNVWQRVKGELKDDLSTAYVRNAHFQEPAYDKYFRDAHAQIIGRRILFSHPEPHLLDEGIEKFHKRLQDAFSRAGFEDVQFEVSDGIR